MTMTPETVAAAPDAPGPSGVPADAPDETTDAPQLAPRQATRWEKVREDAGVWARRAGARIAVIADVIQVTGWVVIAAAVVLWITAFALGWQEAFVAAVVATILALICAVFLFGRTAYDVDLDLTRTRVVVGERAVGALTLANRTSRSLLPSEVVLPVGAGRGLFQVPRLAAGAEHEELFAIPTTARGVLAVGPVSVLRGDPLGLFERTHDRRQAVDLFVHPRTLPLEGLSLGQMRDLEGLPNQHLARDDVSFHALRDYQPGDDLRHVHWKSTARTGTLMVREYEQTRRSHFVVALSTHPGEYRDPEEFETAISVAGSIGLRALRDSRTLDVRTSAGKIRAETGRRYLDSLAAIEPGKPREGGIVALAGILAAHSPDAAVAVLICGSTVDAGQLRLACSRVPFGVRTLAIIADSRLDAPALRRVGDADVVALGELDQLPNAIRKVLS
ncbi:DUF58 domain-containing protein [Microbacterium oleivorans]|uniref:DUF58 domain-containing protein n=1 Tax=Microbacterium oleivorans TaxID=273677 RepID=A0A177K5V5_9MICO|nr:DUF58 domain-containing protein [Microbacterium oleivorans]OAH48790.1 hypothetical protein AYL44_12185 [Microbacterium oleivorans]